MLKAALISSLLVLSFGCARNVGSYDSGSVIIWIDEPSNREQVINLMTTLNFIVTEISPRSPTLQVDMRNDVICLGAPSAEILISDLTDSGMPSFPNVIVVASSAENCDTAVPRLTGRQWAEMAPK